GLLVNKQAGILGVHAGNRSDIEFGCLPADLGAGHPISARGKSRPGNHQIRTNLLHPGPHRRAGLGGAFVEERIAADERRDYRARILEEEVQGAARPHRTIAPLWRQVRALLAPDAGKELIDVMTNTQHTPSPTQHNSPHPPDIMPRAGELGGAFRRQRLTPSARPRWTARSARQDTPARSESPASSRPRAA